MRRLHAPLALGLTGLLTLSAACELDYESIAIEEVDAEPSHFESGGGGWGGGEATEEEDDGSDSSSSGPIFQSRWLRAPYSGYRRTPLNGMRIPGSLWPTVRDLRFEDGQLQGKIMSLIGWSAGYKDISGTGLEGAVVAMEFLVPYVRQGEVPGRRDYTISDVMTLSDFDEHEKTLPLHRSVTPGPEGEDGEETPEVFVYKLETDADYDNDGIPDGHLCQAPHYDPDNRLWQYAIAVPVDWDDTGSAEATTRTGKFTFACLNSAAAKCRLWGYDLESTSLAYVNACTRMVMADYCGTGKPYTLDGTAINFADSRHPYDGGPINSVAHFDRTGQVYEALWGKDGMYCMSDYRIKNSARVPTWHNGQEIEIDRTPGGDEISVPDEFCGGLTPYGKPVQACYLGDLQQARVGAGRAVGLGYDLATDVVIANSSEADYWITQAAEDDWNSMFMAAEEVDPNPGSDDTTPDGPVIDGGDLPVDPSPRAPAPRPDWRTIPRPTFPGGFSL